MSDDEKTIIDDLIILGRSVPVEIQNGRRPICVGGYSPSRGFIRLYPTFSVFPIKRWSICEVEVERPRTPRYDGRIESWKICGDRQSPRALLDKIIVSDKFDREEWPDLLASIQDPCVSVLNDEKRSLGIIKPTINSCYFTDNEAYKNYRRMTLDGSFQVQEINEFEYKPRINYTCPDCRTKQGFHDQQLLEWGAYEYMRKFPRTIDKLWENLQLDNPDYEKYFFVGNLLQHLRSFMVISVLRFKKSRS